MRAQKHGIYSRWSDDGVDVGVYIHKGGWRGKGSAIEAVLVPVCAQVCSGGIMQIRRQRRKDEGIGKPEIKRGRRRGGI